MALNKKQVLKFLQRSSFFLHDLTLFQESLLLLLQIFWEWGMFFSSKASVEMR